MRRRRPIRKNGSSRRPRIRRIVLVETPSCAATSSTLSSASPEAIGSSPDGLDPVPSAGLPNTVRLEPDVNCAHEGTEPVAAYSAAGRVSHGDLFRFDACFMRALNAEADGKAEPNTKAIYAEVLGQSDSRKLVSTNLKAIRWQHQHRPLNPVPPAAIS